MITVRKGREIVTKREGLDTEIEKGPSDEVWTWMDTHLLWKNIDGIERIDLNKCGAENWKKQVTSAAPSPTKLSPERE